MFLVRIKKRYIWLSVSIALLLLLVCFFYPDSPHRQSQQTHGQSSLLPLKSVILPLKVNSAESAPLESANTTPDYIIQCDNIYATRLESDELAIEQVLLSFQDSIIPKQLLAYSLFSKTNNQQTRIDKLLRFTQRFPNNVLALTQLVRLCSSEKALPACSDDLINSAIASDPNNGALWLDIANYYAQRQDSQASKNAIYQVINGSFFNEHYAQIISLFVDSLVGSQADNFTLNALAALGHASANLPYAAHITAFCRDEVSEHDRINLCLNLAETLEDRGNLVITNMLGNNLKGLIYAQLNDHETAAKVAVRAKKITMPLDNKQFEQALMLAFHDQNLFRAWLHNMQDLGELTAAQMLTEEAILLSKNPFYRPCL